MNMTDRHEALYKAQQASLPHLTVREMGRVLKLKSPSHVFLVLCELEAEGLAERIPNGDKSIWRIKRGFSYRHKEVHE